MEGYAKNEQVRDVVGYEGLYGVSNKGNVYSLRSGCLIEGQKGAYVTLSKDGKGKSWRIGDLVAMAWIRNVGGLRFVRHKDGDIRHNVVSNLEFCNEKEKPRRSDARRVLQLDLMGALVGKFNSIADASLVTGVDKGSISRCCRGRAVSAGRYRWKFEGR